MTIKEAKKRLRATNTDIARWFGYRNLESYQNSSGKPDIEAGILEVVKALEKP